MTGHPPLGNMEVNLIGETMTKFTKEQQQVLESAITFCNKKTDILQVRCNVGSVKGDVWGDVLGDVVGDVGGNVRGDVGGNVGAKV